MRKIKSSLPGAYVSEDLRRTTPTFPIDRIITAQYQPHVVAFNQQYDVGPSVEFDFKGIRNKVSSGHEAWIEIEIKLRMPAHMLEERPFAEEVLVEKIPTAEDSALEYVEKKLKE